MDLQNMQSFFLLVSMILHVQLKIVMYVTKIDRKSCVLTSFITPISLHLIVFFLHSLPTRPPHPPPDCIFFSTPLDSVSNGGNIELKCVQKQLDERNTSIMSKFKEFKIHSKKYLHLRVYNNNFN